VPGTEPGTMPGTVPGTMRAPSRSARGSPTPWRLVRAAVGAW